MKIGFFVTGVAEQKGSEYGVSAHVQIPLHTMKLLRDAGHAVQLITTEIPRGEVLPGCVPSGVPVHEVRRPDANIQANRACGRSS